MKQRQKSNQKKSVQNGTDATVMASQTQKKHQTHASSIYIIVLCLVAFISPLLHVVLDVKGMEGYLGYKYMSSFLFAAGNRLSSISIALLFIFAAKQIQNHYRKTFLLTSYTALFIASFFAVQILVPKHLLVQWSGIKDLPPYVYYVAMVIGGFASVFILTYFQTAVMYSEEKLKKIISVLMESLYKGLEEKNLINPWKTKEFKQHRIDVTNKVVDYEQGK